MVRSATLVAIFLSLAGFCHPFSVSEVLTRTSRSSASGGTGSRQQQQQQHRRNLPRLDASAGSGGGDATLTRREAFGRASSAASLAFATAAAAATRPQIALADVSDGTALPQGAAQFSRVLRLKSDLKSVRDRVKGAGGGGDGLDKKEWDNVGQFLRIAYATGDDMKAVAAGVANPDNKKRALEDVDQLRKYAQAGDVSVSRQDASGFVAVADKMIGLVDDFLDSLSDVPDEI